MGRIPGAKHVSRIGTFQKAIDLRLVFDERIGVIVQAHPHAVFLDRHFAQLVHEAERLAQGVGFLGRRHRRGRKEHHRRGAEALVGGQRLAGRGANLVVLVAIEVVAAERNGGELQPAVRQLVAVLLDRQSVLAARMRGKPVSRTPLKPPAAVSSRICSKGKGWPPATTPPRAGRQRIEDVRPLARRLRARHHPPKPAAPHSCAGPAPPVRLPIVMKRPAS